MNIVCIGAHQDDIDIHCLGTLLRYHAQGDVVITNVSVSNGDKGAQYDLSMAYEDVTAMRNAEAAEIVESLGGRFICMGLPDEYVRDTDEARNQMTDILREAKADIVFAPPPVDYNPDHIVSGQIAYQACLMAPIRTIYTDHDPLPDFPAMYYMDSVAGLDWQPTHYVDISHVFERKCELLQLYKSQMRNMEQFGGWDLVTYARILSAFRGLQCSVQCAEAFKPVLAWPRVRAGNMLP